MLLLLGQGVGPVPPDQAGGEVRGVPCGIQRLCHGPAQAGGHRDGEDEADAHLHLHGCREAEWGRGAEGLQPPNWGCELSLWQGATHGGVQGARPQDTAGPQVPSVPPSRSPLSLLSGPQVFSALSRCWSPGPLSPAGTHLLVLGLGGGVSARLGGWLCGWLGHAEPRLSSAFKGAAAGAPPQGCQAEPAPVPTSKSLFATTSLFFRYHQFLLRVLTLIPSYLWGPFVSLLQ